MVDGPLELIPIVINLPIAFFFPPSVLKQPVKKTKHPTKTSEEATNTNKQCQNTEAWFGNSASIDIHVLSGRPAFIHCWYCIRRKDKIHLNTGRKLPKGM